MYFKSLEIFGFKSFAGKTKIDFEPGITAIVGPNGCGKSNVVDALKWVLGEQSAKDLRGTNMEDVIFNGTDTRDPVGFAEVSLTMSNESKFLPIEYGEVIITRRLYRSGESEYLLNRNAVRLKDIIELFMGTGVGTSAYSIIEQGKIGMIISSKPEERRYIFEEASGIIKYKSKKREAIRKLEYTENNLLRVNDIIQEVKRQIGSIERQAKKAERYKADFDRLKDLDTKIAFVDFQALAKSHEDLERDIQASRTKEAALAQSGMELNAQLGELRSKQASVDAALADVQLREMNLTSAVERARHKIALDEERMRELETLKTTLTNEQATLQKNIIELEETVRAFAAEIAAISGSRAEKESLAAQNDLQFKSVEETLAAKELEIRETKLKLVDVLSRHAHAKNESSRLAGDSANQRSRLGRLIAEEESVSKEEAALKDQAAALAAQVRDLEERFAQSTSAKAALQELLNRKDEEKVSVEKSREELQAKKLTLESRLALLQDMVKRYEGFGGGPRSILIEKQESRLPVPGVYGALADIINVNKGYELAVESTLGDLLQCIVVEDRQAAVALIEYLKRNNMGKTTIASLDSLTPEETGEAPVHNGQRLACLADVVTAQERFIPLIRALFSNVFLVADIGALAQSTGTARKGITLVTASGEIFRNGFMTGGMTKEDIDTGILNRKIQVQEITAEVGRLHDQITALTARNDSLTAEMNVSIESLNAQEQALRQTELELANRKSQKENAENSVKKVAGEHLLLGAEIKEVEQEAVLISARLAACEETITLAESQQGTLQATILSSQTLLDQALKEKERLLIDITRMRTELAAVAEQERQSAANLAMRTEFLKSQKELVNEKERSFAESLVRQQELQAEIASLRVVIESSTTDLQKVVQEFGQVREQKTALESQAGRVDADFKANETNLAAVKELLYSASMSQQEATFKTETLKTRMHQFYRVDIAQAQVTIEDTIDWDAVKIEAGELREKIERLGAVNLIAIEEHQELQGRYDFLIKQHEDLTLAKESLHEAIRKINKTTRELFMDTFQKVRVEFKEYFKFLFGGGQAELVLMDEQDILECGIEIMARPPGKKLQSISLLSGGEKALTASALLFSIFKVKPSPFCILDEVDAPLDESNIGRFSKVLMDFSKTSQFIIITHNKRTMSMADIMYGITMEQSGVSKVVSVKFSKEKEAPHVRATREDVSAALPAPLP